MAARTTSAPVIPLRPELVEFLDARSLYRYTCCSATVRRDVREAKAWELLARRLAPRTAQDKNLAAESDAVARVRSHVLRRRLADALSPETPAPQGFQSNQFSDFTYFVRFEEDGVVVWEGDLTGTQRDSWDGPVAVGDLWIDLSRAWAEIEASGSWDGMVDFLSVLYRDPGLIHDANAHAREHMERISITVVAIRDSDQAMVSLGRFAFDDSCGDYGAAKGAYAFDPVQPLLAFPRFELQSRLFLCATHDDMAGGGSLDELLLTVSHVSDEARQHNNFGDNWVGYREEDDFRYLLTYLAGVHHVAGEQARATIEAWHEEGMREEGYVLEDSESRLET